jgi:hypothetical protein
MLISVDVHPLDDCADAPPTRIAATSAMVAARMDTALAAISCSAFLGNSVRIGLALSIAAAPPPPPLSLSL